MRADENKMSSTSRSICAQTRIRLSRPEQDRILPARESAASKSRPGVRVGAQGGFGNFPPLRGLREGNAELASRRVGTPSRREGRKLGSRGTERWAGCKSRGKRFPLPEGRKRRASRGAESARAGNPRREEIGGEKKEGKEKGSSSS